MMKRHDFPNPDERTDNWSSASRNRRGTLTRVRNGVLGGVVVASLLMLAIFFAGQTLLTWIYDNAKPCRIKGDVSVAGGRRLYHVPGQKSYAGTNITPSKGERWFCSEEEAEKAGWRKAGG